MRYNRTELEYIAEALAVALVLNFKIRGDKENEIVDLIEVLNKTVSLHEYYSQQFTKSADSKELLEKYDNQLIEIAEELKLH